MHHNRHGICRRFLRQNCEKVSQHLLHDPDNLYLQMFFIFDSLCPLFSLRTWKECVSDVNGKKLSLAVGQNDEEKLADICKIIEQHVQDLNPYQPTASSQVLVKLCCRIPTHNKQPVLDICPGAFSSVFTEIRILPFSHINPCVSFRPRFAVQRVHVRPQPLGLQYQASEAS